MQQHVRRLPAITTALLEFSGLLQLAQSNKRKSFRAMTKKANEEKGENINKRVEKADVDLLGLRREGWSG